MLAISQAKHDHKSQILGSGLKLYEEGNLGGEDAGVYTGCRCRTIEHILADYRQSVRYTGSECTRNQLVIICKFVYPLIILLAVQPSLVIFVLVLSLFIIVWQIYLLIFTIITFIQPAIEADSMVLTRGCIPGRRWLQDVNWDE
ncbi:hypothetical protein K488DRAFT_70660 [Vararia minispora EC-137]|uniref:Uncharacterized protein n=1 Tax=Vararia minispora EC-137 TaxID=1314806 RepID=A0ACB8QL70_9AGAM|nr:hypothetical protein K488DRAFT_70660 [Vararia minispora EC-137]